MTAEVLREHRLIWERKPVLREIYSDYYRRIVEQCVPGLTLEIGGGSGNLKEFKGDVLSTDIVWVPWLDAVADAQALPFNDGSFQNIVMVDVLHHIESPMAFFREARRILADNGRIVFIEPAITPISGIFFRWFHPEPVEMDVDPFVDPVKDPGRVPFDANQAIPTLLFVKYRKTFEGRFPGLRIRIVKRFSPFVYPMSGGFRSWSLLPNLAAKTALKLERVVEEPLSTFLAFRILVVIERFNGNTECNL